MDSQSKTKMYDIRQVDPREPTLPPGALDDFGPDWKGCRIEGDKLILTNGEAYTLCELQGLRWERDNWRRIAQAVQRDLKKTGMENAVVFSLEDLSKIREALRMLDLILPGLSMQIPQRRKRHA